MNPDWNWIHYCVEFKETLHKWAFSLDLKEISGTALLLFFLQFSGHLFRIRRVQNRNYLS